MRVSKVEQDVDEDVLRTRRLMMSLEKQDLLEKDRRL